MTSLHDIILSACKNREANALNFSNILYNAFDDKHRKNDDIIRCLIYHSNFHDFVANTSDVYHTFV